LNSYPDGFLFGKKTGLFPSEKYSGLVNMAFFRLFLEAQKK
jgi:hypothetical protein